MSKKNELLEIYNATRVYYEGLLNAKENEHIIKYLMDRGLTAEIIESSGIGFADIQANGLYSFMKQFKYTDDVLVKSELFKYDKDNLLVDRFCNRIMIPIMDLAGNIVSFSGV